MKLCRKCQIKKPIKEFFKHINGKFGVSGRCKQCIKLYQEQNKEHRKIYSKQYGKYYWLKNKKKIQERTQKWLKDNPDKHFGYQLKYHYGITLQTYLKLSQKQNNVCAICNKKEVKTRNGKKLFQLAVDHCHKTGKIRGLLCHACNNGLGRFQDNIQFLRSAIKYLQTHRR